MYLVTGCGVSVICESKEAVKRWMSDMIERGGTPNVSVLAD